MCVSSMLLVALNNFNIATLVEFFPRDLDNFGDMICYFIYNLFEQQFY